MTTTQPRPCTASPSRTSSHGRLLLTETGSMRLWVFQSPPGVRQQRSELGMKVKSVSSQHPPSLPRLVPRVCVQVAKVRKQQTLIKMHTRTPTCILSVSHRPTCTHTQTVTQTHTQMHVTTQSLSHEAKFERKGG